jgi:hypothetical protein
LSPESSFSDSLIAKMSRFPKTLLLIELAALCEIPDIGVGGGVVRGRIGGCAEFVAVTEGTEPRVGVGLLITLEPGVGTEESGVTDEMVEDPVGLAGRGGSAKAVVAGEGAGMMGQDFAREGDVAKVGVGRGVVLAEDVAVLM